MFYKLKLVVQHGVHPFGSEGGTRNGIHTVLLWYFASPTRFYHTDRHEVAIFVKDSFPNERLGKLLWGDAVAQSLTIPGVGEAPDTVLSSANDYRIRGDADPQYYGADSNAPTEATTRFSYSEEWHTNDNQQANEVAVYGVFGGTR